MRPATTWSRLIATTGGSRIRQRGSEPDLPFVQRLLDERAPGQARVRDLVWSSRFRIHHRVADRDRAGRLFLAGDAAHGHSPAGGQGMNTGIQDAYALGRAFATGALDGHEPRRRPVALRAVAFTDRMTRIATARGPPAGPAQRRAAAARPAPAFRDRLAREPAELDYR